MGPILGVRIPSSAMKQRGIIAIVFVVGCATGGVAAQLVVPPVRAGTSPTQWEYHYAGAETTDAPSRYLACAKRALP